MTTLIHRSLAGGEIAPQLYPRADLNKYANAVRLARNFIIPRTGGAQNRNGTQFCGEVYDSSNVARLIPFIITAGTSYAMELGNLTMRFLYNGQYVTKSQARTTGFAITAITNANPAVVTAVGHRFLAGQKVHLSGIVSAGVLATRLNGNTFIAQNITANTFSLQNLDGTNYDSTTNGPYASGGYADGPFVITGITKASAAVVTTASAHGLSNGQRIVISEVIGMTQLNGGTYLASAVTATTVTLQYLSGSNVNSTGMGTYISGGAIEAIFVIATSYLATDLALLKYTQKYNTLVLTHQSYTINVVTLNTSSTLFTLATSYRTDLPDTGIPQNVILSTAAGVVTFYAVTAIGLNGEESNTSVFTGTSATASAGTPVQVSWDVVSNAYSYNVYRRTVGASSNSPTELIVAGATGSIIDNGIQAIQRVTAAPDIIPALIPTVGTKPCCAGFFQQRIFFGSTPGNPEGIWASWISHLNNFFPSYDPNDSQPLAFTLAGNRINEIQHFVPLNTFFILTKTTEFVCQPQSGTITPTDFGLTPFSYFGSYYVQPIPIGNRFLFVQARGSIIRDFGFEYTADNYQGNDLTIFATHLFDGYTVADWGYQQTPNSIIWVARNDGTLLSLTYIRDQQILAWTRHDFQGGTCENVCTIPDTQGDTVYFVVKRSINGRTVRYVERMLPSHFSDVVDCTFMDSFLSYDGRNTGTRTMTISGGSTWLYTETLTLTASSSFFLASDVGNEIQVFDENGDVIRFAITGYSSGTVVTGKPNRTVPVSLRGVPVTEWSRAVATVAGLQHLESEDVSIFADGFVVGSPNNPTVATVYTVVGGQVTLDRPYAVIHVGLPFVSDLETLDIDMAQAETLADKKKIVSKVTVYVNQSRGMWIGNNPNDAVGTTTLTGLDEWKARDEEGYDDPVALHMDQVEVNIQPAANKNGRVFIRQVDPVPLTVCAIAPAGLFPLRGN